VCRVGADAGGDGCFMDDAKRNEIGVAREGILALYRAHAGARQMPLEHVRRIVRRSWHDLEDVMTRAPGASIARAMALAEAFYLRHQPFRTDRTIYVGMGKESGAAPLTIGGVPIDRIALTSRDVVLHLFGRETLTERSSAAYQWSDACEWPSEAGASDCAVPHEGIEVVVVEHDLALGVQTSSRLAGFRPAGSMIQ